MIAFNTNLLVRALLMDNPEHVAVVRLLVAEDTLFLSRTALLEAEWILRSRRHLPRWIRMHRRCAEIGPAPARARRPDGSAASVGVQLIPHPRRLRAKAIQDLQEARPVGARGPAGEYLLGL